MKENYHTQIDNTVFHCGKFRVMTTEMKNTPCTMTHHRDSLWSVSSHSDDNNLKIAAEETVGVVHT